MSQGSKVSFSRLVGTIADLLRPKANKNHELAAPTFAHPWSAYRPETHLAGRPSIAIDPQSSANCALQGMPQPLSAIAAVLDVKAALPPPLPPAASIIPFAPRTGQAPPRPQIQAENLAENPAGNMAEIASPQHTAVITALILPGDRLQPASTASIHAQIEEAISAAAVSPTPLVTTITRPQNFHLAARLRSIAVLNRPVSSEILNRQKDRIKEHGKSNSRAYRPLTITPPAVLRDKPRNSATVLRFNAENRPSERRGRTQKHVA